MAEFFKEGEGAHASYVLSTYEPECTSLFNQETIILSLNFLIFAQKIGFNF